MEIKSSLISYVTISSFSHCFFPPLSPNPVSTCRSTYQRMSLQPNESYGLQRRGPSLPAMPLPDLTILPHEPIHQLKGGFFCSCLPSILVQCLNAASCQFVFFFSQSGTFGQPKLDHADFRSKISFIHPGNLQQHF